MPSRVRAGSRDKSLTWNCLSLRIARSCGRTGIENNLSDVTVYDDLFLIWDLFSGSLYLSHCRYPQSPRQ